MRSTSGAERGRRLARLGVALAGLVAVGGVPAQPAPPAPVAVPLAAPFAGELAPSRLALGPIGAFAAVGDLAALRVALAAGLDAGLSVEEAKEALVQLYAYAGFPRSLNALATLMEVVEERGRNGIRDAAGRSSGPVPVGAELLAVGTANQTRLSGAPVRGPLFEFAPAIDRFLKTHLFGDVFARDNLDWVARELTTVAVLGALPGVEPQLLAHVRISTNIGIGLPQLRRFADALADRGAPEAAARVRRAIEAHAR